MRNRDVVLWCALAVILSVAGTVGSAEVTLSWTSPGDDGRSGQATVYDLRYSLTNLADANWDNAFRVNGVPAPQAAGSREAFTITGLADGTTYYFALKSADEAFNWSPMSNVAVRTTPVAVPPAPTLASPASGSTGISTSPSLIWNALNGATSYRVQVSTDSTFAVTVADQGNIVGTSTNLAALSINTIYYWRVCATNGSATGLFSAAWSFTTYVEPPPPAPALVSPTDGATSLYLNPLLVWNTSSSAASYRLQLSTNPSFGSLVVDRSGLADTVFIVPSLKTNTTYYWRVSAANNGGSGAYSTPHKFRTNRKKKFASYTVTGEPGKPEAGAIPRDFALWQNFPNPFNPTTRIEFDLPEAVDVRIVIFNVLGQAVRRLVDEPMAAGTHLVTWDARSDAGAKVSAGIYFYRLEAGDFIDTKKMVLLK